MRSLSGDSNEEGADPSQKPEVLHYLYVPSSDAANQVANTTAGLLSRLDPQVR